MIDCNEYRLLKNFKKNDQILKLKSLQYGAMILPFTILPCY